MLPTFSVDWEVPCSSHLDLQTIMIFPNHNQVRIFYHKSDSILILNYRSMYVDEDERIRTFG